jgi:hypothetical protein
MKHHLHSQGREVYLDGKQLDPEPSLAIVNHSPDGFNWGYGGSGPSQLALAILLELKGEEEALKNYQAFKREVIATLPREGFDIWLEI